MRFVLNAAARALTVAGAILAVTLSACLPNREAKRSNTAASVATDQPPAPQPSDGAGACPYVAVADTVPGRASILGITGDLCGNVELLSVKPGSLFENCGQEGDFIRVKYKEAEQGNAPMAQGAGGCNTNADGESYIKGCVHRRDLVCVGAPGSGAATTAANAQSTAAKPSSVAGGPTTTIQPTSATKAPTAPSSRCRVGQSFCTVVKNGTKCWKPGRDTWEGQMVVNDDQAILNAGLTTCLDTKAVKLRVAEGLWFQHYSATALAMPILGTCYVESSSLRCSP